MQRSLRWVCGCFLAIIILILTSVGFARFVHYHAQNTLLGPGDYTVEVLTAADYQRLADPKVRVVTLTSGMTIAKGDAFDVKRYQPVGDGNHYVFVMLTGTAPMMPLLYRTLFPLLVLAVVGIFAASVALKHCPKGETETET